MNESLPGQNTDEPSSQAQELVRTPPWRETASEIALLRMSALDRVLLLLGKETAEREAFLKQAQRECAMRIDAILASGNQTSEHEVPAPPSRERIKKEERVRPLFIEVRNTIERPTERLRGLDKLNTLYESTRDEEERAILQSWARPVLRGIITAELDKPENIIGIQMLRKVLYGSWFRGAEWNDIRDCIHNNPAIFRALQTELSVDVGEPWHFGHYRTGLHNAGLDDVVESARPEFEALACNYLAGVLEKKSFGRSSLSRREIDRDQEKYLRCGIFTHSRDIAEIIPYYLGQAFIERWPQVRSGQAVMPPFKEYTRRRALFEESDIDARNVDIRNHPALTKAAGEYIVRKYAHPPFDQGQFEFYGKEVAQLVDAGIADRTFFDTLPEIAAYLESR